MNITQKNTDVRKKVGSLQVENSILIAGLGSIGRRHLRNLQSLQVSNLRGLRTYRGSLTDDDLEGVHVDTDLEQALSSNPQAVVVANPTASHLSVAIPAAQAGCHLFLEKPISHSLDGVEALTQTVKAHNLKVFVGFQFRFHPGLQKIKTLLANQTIGRVVSVNAHWGEYLPNWHPWEDYRLSYSARRDLGGGVILTLCHPIDYLRWLLGDMTEVSAFVGESNVLGIEVEETAEIILKTTEGTLVRIHLDYVQRPPRHTLELVGESGTIHWDNNDGTVTLHCGDSIQVKEFRVPEDFERNSMFRDEMSHFLDCLQGREEPICTLHDGLQALRIALAAKQSAIERRSISLVEYENRATV